MPKAKKSQPAPRQTPKIPTNTPPSTSMALQPIDTASAVTHNSQKTTQNDENSEIRQIIADKYVHGLKDKDLCGKYGLSRSTLYRRLRTAEAQEIRYRMTPRLLRGNIANKWYDIADRSLAVLAKKNIGKAKISELKDMAKVATETLMTLSGQATAIVEHRVIVGVIPALEGLPAMHD